MRHVLDRQLLLHVRQHDLCFDEGVIKPGVTGRLGSCGKKYPGWASPVDSPQTHGAWFTTAIDLAFGEVKIAEHLARISNCHHLSMCRGIIRGSHLVRAGCNDRSVFNYQRAKWPTPRFTFSSANWMV